MKIESRQIVSQADIKKIIQLNESVKGTTDYMKYHMEMSYKHDNTKKGGFTNWKFLGYGYPFEHDEKEWSNSGYVFKIVKGHVYIETFQHKDSYGTTQIERWYVTDRIMEEMGWWIW